MQQSSKENSEDVHQSGERLWGKTLDLEIISTNSMRQKMLHGYIIATFLGFSLCSTELEYGDEVMLILS